MRELHTIDGGVVRCVFAVGNALVLLILFGQGCVQSPTSHFQNDIAHLPAEEIRRLPGVPAQIPLDRIYDGGPGIDGIPSIDTPVFETVEEASSWLPDDSLGMLVTVGSSSRYYPFPILAWHEVVNDVIDNEPILISYCPLCKTGIVFSRNVTGTTLIFGVSGKLYENNLLMYNKNGGPSSLWSQVLGRAIAGALTGTELVILPQLHVRWKDLKKQYMHSSSLQVLSRDTGFVRDYTKEPYKEYYESGQTLFPLQVRDTRLDDKTSMFALVVNGTSKAYPLNEAREAAPFYDRIAERQIRFEWNENLATIEAVDVETERLLPAIESFWFAWVSAHPDTGLWRAEDREAQ